MEISQNRSLLFCCPVKEQCIFVDLLQIKDKFHCQESFIIHGLSAYERAKQKKNPIVIFKSVRVPRAYERVSAYRNVQIQSLTGR